MLTQGNHQTATSFQPSSLSISIRRNVIKTRIPIYLSWDSKSNNSNGDENATLGDIEPFSPTPNPNLPKLKKKATKSNKNNPQNIKAKSIAKGRDPLISLNMNLDYLAKTGAPRRAEELLLKIENLYKEG